MYMPGDFKYSHAIVTHRVLHLQLVIYPLDLLCVFLYTR